MTAVSDRCSFNSSRRGALRHPLHAVSGPWRQLLSRRPQERESEHPSHSGVGSLGSDGSFVSIGSGPSDQRRRKHERALTRRELAHRAVAADRAPTELTGIPTTGAPRAGFSTGGLGLGAAGRMTRRDHHLAPRLALVRATRAEIGRARDRSIAHRTSSGSAVRDRLLVRHRPTGVPLRSQDGAASLELIHQQQFIVASQRGVIMRGRKRSELWPPARTPDVVSNGDEPIEADAQTDAALLALVRLLARQAAREVFARTVTESDSSFDEGRE